jgi:hypothetical protein
MSKDRRQGKRRSRRDVFFSDDICLNGQPNIVMLDHAFFLSIFRQPRPRRNRHDHYNIWYASERRPEAPFAGTAQIR